MCFAAFRCFTSPSAHCLTNWALRHAPAPSLPCYAIWSLVWFAYERFTSPLLACFATLCCFRCVEPALFPGPAASPVPSINASLLPCRLALLFFTSLLRCSLRGRCLRLHFFGASGFYLPFAGSLLPCSWIRCVAGWFLCCLLSYCENLMLSRVLCFAASTPRGSDINAARVHYFSTLMLCCGYCCCCFTAIAAATAAATAAPFLLRCFATMKLRGFACSLVGSIFVASNFVTSQTCCFGASPSPVSCITGSKLQCCHDALPRVVNAPLQ